MRRILVVEDSPAMRGFIASTAEQMDDVEVVDVGSGFDALKRLPTEKFDLVVTDINMPDINGLELLSFIRGNRNYHDTPVLVVTSESTEAQRQKALELGANALVTKPFEADELLARIEELLIGVGK